MRLMQRNIKKCGQLISIRTRSIVPPSFGSVDSGLDFVEKHSVKAVIRTVRGQTLFDGVSTDQVITHKFGIEFLSGITAEDWIIFESRRFDIIDVENCSERGLDLILRCVDRGTKEASKA